MRRCAIVFFVCLFAGLDVQAGKEYPAKPGEEVVVNELIVHLMPGATVATLIAKYLPAAQIQALAHVGFFRIRVPAGLPNGISALIAADSQVDFVEPNRVRHSLLAAPNDPNYASSWWFPAVQALQAWSLLPGQYLTAATAGTTRVKVAVLDTGADCTHPDFINTGGSSTDSAHGGQLMFSASQAIVQTTIGTPVCLWQDDHGHGTHVTGILAAATSNSAGVSGLAYPVQVMEFKVLNSAGSGSDTDIMNGIEDAANAGAQVVSMSLGGTGYSSTLQTAINYAWQHNTLVVAAAGNDAKNELFFPAAANHAVGVSATDSGNNLAYFSNFGNAVQLAAPGLGILSTAPTYSGTSQGWLNYVSLSGTSMATPFVSALAGLVAMTTPNATAQSILQRMEQTASSTTTGGGWGQNFGFGLINASGAVAGTLRAAVNGAITGQITDTSSNPISGAQITINSQNITTDATGLYRFGTLPAGTYTVTVSATGYATQSLNATVTAGADTSFTVTMGVSYGKFTGTVTDQGVGVAGAIVQSLSAGLITGVAVADQNGQYTLWVPAGTYDVRASAIGRVTATVPALIIGTGGTTTANLTLPRMGTIAGSVRDGSSNPVPNAQVLVTGGGFSAAATTDVNGNYSLIGVPAGTQYSVTASATGFLSSTQNGIAVSADATTTLNFTITAVNNSAAFVKTDTTTQGSWKGVYGASGYNVLDDTVSYPGSVTVTPAGQLNYVWVPSTSDVRALQKVLSSTDRLAATWYTYGSYTIDLNFNDALQHQVAVYCLDWDGGGARTQTISILDGSTNAVLNTQTVSSFQNGKYVIWSLTGHVVVKVTNAGAVNAAISGLFFDPVGSGSTVATPTFTPPAGAYSSAQTVTISTTTPGASIRYTTDGSTIPSSTVGTLYTGPVSVSSNLTLQAVAYMAGMTNSAVSSASYTIQAAAPTFTPPGGAYGSAQAVTISTTTPGASIRYTTDGSTIPSSTVGTLYTGPVSVSSNLTLQAVAYMAGMTSSVVSSASYSIQTATPTFTPPGGAYSSAQSVTISTTTPGASIRYTTDGSTPSSTVGTQYTGSVSVSSNLTLKAVAYMAGITDSLPGSAAYTITGPVSVPMSQYNFNRTGANLNEPVLNTGNVNPAQFGKLFSRTVDDSVYGLPLIIPSLAIAGGVHDVLFVATMNNSVYAFDAVDPTRTQPYWSVNLGTPGVGSTFIGPVNFGILSTPFIDTTTNTLYVVAEVRNGTDVGLYIFALDITTGLAKYNSPRRMSFTFPVEGVTLTNVTGAIQRAGLLVSNGVLYVAVANVVPNDYDSQEGFVQSFDAHNLSTQLGTFQSTPSATEGKGGIWEAGRGLPVDASGVYFSVAGGAYSSTANPPNFGSSIVKVAASTLSVQDWFAPQNWQYLFANNIDPAAGGVTLIPGTSLLFAGGKEGVIYLLNRNSMGHLEGTDGQPVQRFQASYGCAQNSAAPDCGQSLGTSYWDQGGSGMLYVWDKTDVLRAYPFNGQTFNAVSPQVGTLAIGMTGGPSLSANGADPSTAIVWAVTTTNIDSNVLSAGTLRAFRADNITQELYDSDVNQGGDSLGTMTKFAPPVVANGRVYVSTQSNSVQVYGLLAASRTAQTITFGPLANQTVGVAPITIAATATSGLPVSFNSLTIAVCTVAGNSVTILAVGTCSVQAIQTGNATYSAALPVIQSFTVNPAAQAATPTFTPPGGAYDSAQSVTISTTTPGASIRYTTDGSTTPSSTVGTLYTGPVSVSRNLALQAVAYMAGITNSAVSSASYTISGGASGNSAAFVKTDTTTQGSWKGVYGASGYNVLDDTVSYPGSVTVTPAGQLNYVWVPSTSDVRALQKVLSSTDRLAATWYTYGSYTIDLNFNDALQHQVAVYCLDWDGGGARTQTISILDGSTNAVLNTQTVSSFQNGKYVIWSLTGHVVVKVTNAGAVNAAISGLFFDPVGSGSTVATPTFTPPAGAYSSAQTVTISTTTPGASIRYTTDGSTIPSSTVGTLYTGPVSVSSNLTLQAVAYMAGMTNSAVSSASYTIQAAAPTFTPPGGAYGSAQAVTISTTTPGASIRYTTDGSTIPSSTVGTLYTGPVSVSSNLTLQAVAYMAGMTSSVVSSASYAISGAIGNTAVFVKADITTQGSWKGVYGTKGYNVIDDTVSYPGNVTVTPAGQLNYVWVASTTDVRAPEKVLSSTDRLAATWYTYGSYTIDLNFNDGLQHQLAVYCLDWDSGGGRTQTISILDGSTNAVLNTQTVSNFQNGKYVVWNLTGHVVIKVTNSGAVNAVISGLFFD